MEKRFIGKSLSLGAIALAVFSLTMVSSPAFAVEGGAEAIGESCDSVINAAEESPLPLADAAPGSVIRGDGWMLDEDGVLTIEKDIPKSSDLRYEWWPYDELVREVRLAEGVTTIPTGAFVSYVNGDVEFSNLTKFTACSTLKTIGWGAFSGTRSLTEVRLNDGLEAVNHSAFADTGITSIVLPDNVTWGGDCFAGCSKLGGTLVIPGGSKFEDGGNGTFYGVGVETVVIEDGVTWIPNSAFNGCANLKRVYLPKSVVQIGDTSETAPGIYYCSFDPCMIIGYKGTAAEQYVDHWLKVNPEENRGLSFHAIDGEEHEFGPWETVSEATCAEPGARRHVCGICGAERTETLPALGHAWGEGIVTVQPTVSAEGERTFTCGRCGVTRTEAIARLEQELPVVTGENLENAKGNLPATGDPVSALGILASTGIAIAAVGKAPRRRK